MLTSVDYIPSTPACLGDVISCICTEELFIDLLTIVNAKSRAKQKQKFRRKRTEKDFTYMASS